MSIQVNGTTVIDNNRNINNVGTVTATSFSGSGANLTGIDTGVGLPSFNPSSTPNVRYTSSATWSKPGSLSGNSWVTFYMIGGGGSGATGTWAYGSAGASAAIFSAVVSSLPSSIAFTVGAVPGTGGGSGGMGNTTSATINGRLYQAFGGNTAPLSTFLGPTMVSRPGYYTVPFNGISPLDDNGVGATGGDSGFYAGEESSSVYGGGAGFGGYGAAPATTSTYAGNGGGRGQTGGTPGGGGGGDNNGTPGGGTRGEVRIYYG